MSSGTSGNVHRDRISLLRGDQGNARRIERPRAPDCVVTACVCDAGRITVFDDVAIDIFHQ